jgi:hypothetical protein
MPARPNMARFSVFKRLICDSVRIVLQSAGAARRSGDHGMGVMFNATDPARIHIMIKRESKTEGLRRKFVCNIVHDGSTFSGIGASGKAGAIHSHHAKDFQGRVTQLACAVFLHAQQESCPHPQDNKSEPAYAFICN